MRHGISTPRTARGRRRAQRTQRGRARYIVPLREKAQKVRRGLRRAQPGMAVPQKSKPRRTGKMAVLLKRSHVDDEAVLHVALEQAIVRFVDLLNLDELDIGSDSVLGAEVQHLLGLPNAADG